MCLNMWQTAQFFLQMLLILSTYGGILATPMHTHIYTCISQKFRILALMRSENSTLVTTVVKFGKVSLDLTNSRSQLSLVQQLWVLQMGNSISLLQWLKGLLFLHLSMPLRSIQMWKICCSRHTKMKVSFILEKYIRFTNSVFLFLVFGGLLICWSTFKVFDMNLFEFTFKIHIGFQITIMHLRFL